MRSESCEQDGADKIDLPAWFKNLKFYRVSLKISILKDFVENESN
jgi:hypothetical protein